MKIFRAYEIITLDTKTVLWWKIDTFKAHFSFRSLWTRFFYNCLNWLTLTLTRIYHARQRKQKMKYLGELDENSHSIMNTKVKKNLRKINMNWSKFSYFDVFPACLNVMTIFWWKNGLTRPNTEIDHSDSCFSFEMTKNNILCHSLILDRKFFSPLWIFTCNEIIKV